MQLGVGHVERRHALVAERREGDRVARVVAADHEHHVERLEQQRVHRVLAVLRRAADRVEGAEVLGAIGVAPGPRHREPHGIRDRERLAREHRRLVGDADPREMPVGIEMGTRLRAVLLEERLAREALPFDVVADVAGLLHVAHHEVGPAFEFRDLRRRGARLLVVVLAVDERREPVAGVALDALPHVEHRPAGRVHHDAAEAAKRLEVADRHAERREDHDVLGLDGGVVESRLARLRGRRSPSRGASR